MVINTANLRIAAFDDMSDDINGHEHSEYWMDGGRGSTKSSFVSVKIVELIMRNSFANAVVVRRFSNTLRDSVYNQMLWAIDKMQSGSLFEIRKSPLEIVYKPTGQRIVFRGMDDPLKMKGVVFTHGYCAIIWFEEVDQFANWDVVSSALRTFRRGGDKFWTFYTYNPPQTLWNWVNKKALEMKRKKSVYYSHSTYLDVIESGCANWLGASFIEDAEYEREANPNHYRWEFLGEITGTGGSVFENIVERRITDDEILTYDNARLGVDFGWFPDPWRFVQCEWQPNHRRLIIWGERSANKKTPRDTGEIIRAAQTFGREGAEKYHDDPIWCDEADITSINVYRRECGLNARKADKGHMRKASYQWLSGLREIVIDPERTPLTFEEFKLCEYAKDREGKWIDDYNDGNDHSIDAVRYAVMNDVKRGR